MKDCVCSSLNRTAVGIQKMEDTTNILEVVDWQSIDQATKDANRDISRLMEYRRRIY